MKHSVRSANPLLVAKQPGTYCTALRWSPTCTPVADWAWWRQAPKATCHDSWRARTRRRCQCVCAVGCSERGWRTARRQRSWLATAGCHSPQRAAASQPRPRTSALSYLSAAHAVADCRVPRGTHCRAPRDSAAGWHVPSSRSGHRYRSSGGGRDATRRPPPARRGAGASHRMGSIRFLSVAVALFRHAAAPASLVATPLNKS